MRISTANAFDTSLAQLQKRQKALSDATLQLSSGKRVNRASDDPAAAARAERMQALQARNAADQRSIDTSRQAMSMADTALGDATDLLQQAREALLQAGNGSLSAADRGSLATVLRELRNQLLAVANGGDGAGGHVFAGQGAATPPFRDAPGGIEFTGTGGQNSLSSSQSLPTTLDGEAIWLQTRTGNGVFETRATTGNTGSAVIDAGQVVNPGQLTGAGYSLEFSGSGDSISYTLLKDGQPTGIVDQAYHSGQAITVDGLSFTIRGTPDQGDRFEIVPASATLDIFGALDRAADALGDPAQTEASARQAVAFGLRDVDAVMNQMLAARAEVGGVLNRLDTLQEQLSAQNLAARTAQSEAEDLDLIEGISNVQNQQTALQAALQSYAAVQRLSLMQYVNG